MNSSGQAVCDVNVSRCLGVCKSQQVKSSAEKQTRICGRVDYDRSMRVIQTIIQLPVSQCVEKRCVIFELVSNRVPNHPRFRVILREFGNQNVKAVIDSAALVVHDVIVTSDRCPNKALPWERRVRDGISRVPILARVREPAFVVDTKSNNCRWQILGRMNFVEARGIQQRLPIFRGKLPDICVAQALNRGSKK
jgi:hypothetical protein